MTNNNVNDDSFNIEQENSFQNNKKIFSLTTGFSFRRNVNDTKNPYTLTLISKPLVNYSSSNVKNYRVNNNKKHHIQRLQYYTDNVVNTAKHKNIKSSDDGKSDSRSLHRNGSSSGAKKSDDDSINLSSPTHSSTPRPKISATSPTTPDVKYYLKTVLKRPLKNDDSTENSITESFTELSPQITSDYRNIDSNIHPVDASDNYKQIDFHDNYNDPIVSPYKTLDNLRNIGKERITPEKYRFDIDATSTMSSTIKTFPSTTPRLSVNTSEKSKLTKSRKPSYYLYHVEDEILADQTTEVFNGNVKNVIKNFINNFSSSSSPNLVEYTSAVPKLEDIVVSIGQKKKPNFGIEQPFRSNQKHLKIIKEPNLIRYITPTVETITFTGPNDDFSSSSIPMVYTTTEPSSIDIDTEAGLIDSAPSPDYISEKDAYESKFSTFIKGKSDTEKSKKYHKIINSEEPPNDSHTIKSDENSHFNEDTHIPSVTSENFKELTETENPRLVSDYVSDIASTTSTTKSTTTLKTIIETTPTVKSLSFPTRASRINPAIKLAAAKLGGGRRSYQSSSNCSSDNSLQVNPKCNEIKYQRYSPASSHNILTYFISINGWWRRHTPYFPHCDVTGM